MHKHAISFKAKCERSLKINSPQRYTVFNLPSTLHTVDLLICAEGNILYENFDCRAVGLQVWSWFHSMPILEDSTEFQVSRLHVLFRVYLKVEGRESRVNVESRE